MKKPSYYAAILLTTAMVTPSVFAQRPLGIDVSSYQGSINWASVYSDGVRFAFAHATTGVVLEDADYKSYISHGKAAGLQMGAYDVAQANEDTPGQDASYFWNFAGSTIKADGKSIMPAVALEIFEGHVGTSTYTQWVNDWSADVIADGAAAGVTLRPLLYISACDLCNFNTNNLTLGLWLSNFNGENYETGNPSCASCGSGGAVAWDFWQFSDTGAIAGISGDVDLDTYNGTYTQMVAKEGVTAN